MAGENSLSSYTETNLQLIEEGCTEANLNGGNMLVYVDNNSDAPCLYQVVPGADGQGQRTIVKQYEECNSASPEIMRSVIQEVSEQFPANGMGLVLWSHGTAWLPSNLSSYLRAFGQDGDDYMEINDLADALSEFHFDFLAFDACYMGSVEAAYALRNCADYLIASPTEVLGTGLPYNMIIQPMFSSTADVTGIAQAFYDYYDGKSGVWRSASVSVVRNSSLDNLASVCNGIFSNITTEELWNVQLDDVQVLDYLSGNYHFLYDMDDYLEHLTTDNPQLYTDFCDAFDQCIVYEACTPNNYFNRAGSVAIEKFSGLSVYAPQESLESMNEWYEQLDWWKDVYGAWND